MTTRKIMAGRMPRRWGFLSGIDIGADGDPYLDRLRLIETPWFAVFLHHIHRPDKDPDPHDHPWWFASVVISGQYVDEFWPDKRNPDVSYHRYHGRWILRCLSRKSAHLIKDIEGPLWTLVVTGRSYGSESWGFWVDGKGVQWRVYISANGGQEYAADKDREEALRSCPCGRGDRDHCPQHRLPHPNDYSQEIR